jgi:hypothetical protein
MTAEEQVEQQAGLRRVILFATVVSGLVAAYLMHNGLPGESLRDTGPRCARRSHPARNPLCISI